MPKSSYFRIDLEECHNSKCRRCPSTRDRDVHIHNDLCKTAKSESDSLPVRCIGDWGYEKIYRLVQYFGIFSKGMHKKWPTLNYIEICSGPGRCVMRNNGQEVNGTALCILKHESFRDYLTQALFIDYNKEAIDILSKRIKQASLKDKAKAIHVNFEDLDGIDKHLSALKTNSLNLVLADPTECNLPFETLCKISNELRNVDFIVTIPLGTDIMRNIRNAILNDRFTKAKQKYAKFIGDSAFLDSDKMKQLAEHSNLEELRKAIMYKYRDGWKKLGYKYCSEKSVRHYYRLMFASKDPIGLEFWDKANKYDPNGQMTMEGF